MNRTLKIILAANLALVAVLALVYPHWMVAPGKLIAGHRKLDTDCFACHVAFAGASSAKCVRCHQPADIGRLTSKGVPIVKKQATVPFHQKLASQDCVACHSDHAGVNRYKLHGNFNHALLNKEAADQCQTCHKAPADRLHKQISGNCLQCHTQKQWTPATFDHNTYFVLDGDHNASCVTCHVRNDYSQFTCYGCHEHTPANIRYEHLKEGIRDFERCTDCHRSADEHDMKERGNAGGAGRKREDD